MGEVEGRDRGANHRASQVLEVTSIILLNLAVIVGGMFLVNGSGGPFAAPLIVGGLLGLVLKALP